MTSPRLLGRETEVLDVRMVGDHVAELAIPVADQRRQPVEQCLQSTRLLLRNRWVFSAHHRAGCLCECHRQTSLRITSHR